MDPKLEHAAINFVVTMPGEAGIAAAAVAEFLIAFILMGTVLIVSNSARASKLTPYFTGVLVAFFIAAESPVSGTSMNPARTFGSAVVAGEWNAWWLYFLVPPIAMLAAAEGYVCPRGIRSILCAKLDHSGTARCIFNCGAHVEQAF